MVHIISRFMHVKLTPVLFFPNMRCLTDTKLTGSKSYFMPRSHEDKLHFQLKAFRFHQDDRKTVSSIKMFMQF